MKRHRIQICLLMILTLSVIACGCGRQSDSVQSDVAEQDDLIEGLEAVTTGHTTEITETLSSEQEEATQAQTEEAAYLYELENSLKETIANAGLSANTAVYVQQLSGDTCLAIENRAMQSASLIKLYVAGCVYEQKASLTAQETYAGETDDLVKKMITVSDNDATNTLVKRLGAGDAQAGMNLVNAYCSSHGFEDTSMGRLMLDFEAAADNYTSVKDCAHFLQKVYENALAGSDTILEYLKQQERTGKIPAGVPEGVMTANKTGELEDVENDAAIVFNETTPYILCVMTGDLSDTAAGRDMIVKLSSVAYAYFDAQ